MITMEEKTSKQYKRLNQLVERIGFEYEFQRLKEAGATIDELAESFTEFVQRAIMRLPQYPSSITGIELPELDDDERRYLSRFRGLREIPILIDYYVDGESISGIAKAQKLSAESARQIIKRSSKKHLGIDYCTLKPWQDNNSAENDQYERHETAQIKISNLKNYLYHKTLEIAIDKQEKAMEKYAAS